VRHILAVALLAVVLTRVFDIVGDFRTASNGEAPVESSTEATESVDATETPEGTEVPVDESAVDDDSAGAGASGATQIVVVIIPGLNFRAEPKSNSEVIRTLPKDTRLTLLGEQNGWYEVRTEDGVTGWVTMSSQYVALETAE